MAAVRSVGRKKARTKNAPKVGVRAITPFLWFKDEAELAAKTYVELFRGSRITGTNRLPPPSRRGVGPVQSVSLELAGLPLILFNGGPALRLTPAASLFVSCSTQEQVDLLWARLVRGGRASRCGWLVDRFGLSWQIIPDRLLELLSDADPTRADRAFRAMLRMKKIDLRQLAVAVEGRRRI